jgi:hypothetical protein
MLKTLVIISQAESETAIRIAEKLDRKGEEIVFLFMGKGIHYLDRLEILERISFADIYTFAMEYTSSNIEIKAIDYDDFVDILEVTERTFSWI